jgi:lipid II isoglutaminyl synthase (glutamine-hydrolysing)
MGLRLALETSAARAIGTLSRGARRGGGTTIPGKVLWKLDPRAIDALAARLPSGVVVMSATNGKTTTTAMAAEILEGSHRLAWNRAGANLLSGIASALVASRKADLGLFEVDEGAVPEAVERLRPRIVAFGNLFRDQLDRYGELELVAERWREAVTRLSRETTFVVNADDAVLADIVDGRPGVIRFGLDDPRQARPLQHAADSKYCVRCGAPYTFAAAYVGHLGDYHCPSCDHRRPALDIAARDIELRGLRSSRFVLATPEGTTHVDLQLPGLYNVYNAVAAAGIALAVGASLADVRSGIERFSAAFGRFERIPAGGKAVVLLLIKNPAGANEVVRTLETGVPPVLIVALNDAVADGQDVSWIWDVDFEPILERAGLVIASGGRAAELGLRMTYSGLSRDQLEIVPSLERALDRGLELVEAGTELVVLPTYTAMLELRGVLTDRGVVRPYWEGRS